MLLIKLIPSLNKITFNSFWIVIKCLLILMGWGGRLSQLLKFLKIDNNKIKYRVKTKIYCLRSEHHNDLCFIHYGLYYLNKSKLQVFNSFYVRCFKRKQNLNDRPFYFMN